MTYETNEERVFRTTEHARPLGETAPPNAARAARRADAGVVPSAPAAHWPEPVRLPEWLDEEKAPRHFRCPITLCVIREPAVTPAGISYGGRR